IALAKSSKFEVETRDLDAGDSHAYLVQYLATWVGKALQSFPVHERLEKQTQLINNVIQLLSAQTPDAVGSDDAHVPRAEILRAILRAPAERPDTPLGASCLMTGTRHDPSLVSQLRKEIATADRVDIL